MGRDHGGAAVVMTVGAAALFVAALVLIVLRLGEVIAWSWAWVLVPIWAPYALGAAAFVCFLGAALCKAVVLAVVHALATVRVLADYDEKDNE